MEREIKAVRELAKKRRWMVSPDGRPYLARLFHDLREGNELPKAEEYEKELKSKANGKRIILVGNEGDGEVKALADLDFDVTGVRGKDPIHEGKPHRVLGPNSRIMRGDFTKMHLKPNAYDYVMMRDVLNEHGHMHDKEMLHHLLKSPSRSVREWVEKYLQGERQHTILDSAHEKLKPGGKLISLGYSDHGHALLNADKLRKKWHIEEGHEYEPAKRGGYGDPWEGLHSFLVLKKRH